MVFKYVYELYDSDDKLFWVGVSHNPQIRLNGHMYHHGDTTKMKIVLKEPDSEANLIKEYLSKGIKLKNLSNTKDYDTKLSVGDWLVNHKFKSSVL